MTTRDGAYVCVVCDEPDPDRWVLFGRVAVSNGRRAAYHRWPGDGFNADGANGVLVCWPECTALYLEGLMVEADHPETPDPCEGGPPG